MPSRGTAGKPGGPSNAGCRPPTEKASAGPAPQRVSTAKPPVTGSPCTWLSNSRPSASSVEALASSTPKVSMFNLISGNAGSGTATRTRPITTTRSGSGSVNASARSSETSSLGVPQPSFTVGPNTCCPRVTGNSAPAWRAICGASPIGSFGASTSPAVPARIASRNAATSTSRCNPSSPPIPDSVNPNPSGIGANRPATVTSSEKPSPPSGIRVSRMPNACSPSADSCRLSAPV